MKKIYSILMILAAAAGFTNCSKAELVENKETEKGGTVVYATTDAATKTTLADDYKVLWSTGDQIKFVKDGATTTTYTFTLSSGEGTTNGTFTIGQAPADGTYTVYYPASYDGTNWPAQTYVGATDISGAPMKATATVSGGSVSDISFKNEGGILRYTVKGSKTIKSINVKSGSTLDVTLSCGKSGVALSTEGTVFNIALPAGEYSNATLTFTATDNTVATKTASTFTVTKNKVSLATFEATALSFLPDGALSGEFSVSDDEGTTIKKVHFSKGNLYWDGDSFEFETNQYDIQSDWNPSHVSHFFWSMTASVAYDNVYNSEGENINDEFFTNATNTTAKENFTVNSVTGKYRTLSRYEWQYLLCIREASTVNGTENARCAKAVVNGKSGLIILPDAYDHPSGVAALKNINPENNKTVKFEDNSYDLTDWGKMESAGAVFLPPTGYREPGETHGKKSTPSEIWLPDSFGYYWSSSAYSYNKDSALCTEFTEYNFVTNVLEGRFPGRCVRLVTDVK